MQLYLPDGHQAITGSSRRTATLVALHVSVFYKMAEATVQVWDDKHQIKVTSQQ
eukprot:m.104284 g.104284  ORF g.104284 m.104284 type:complete len:54 (+) comp15233_c0_seq2:801-962(+)